jgi:hypothetical protein
MVLLIGCKKEKDADLLTNCKQTGYTLYYPYLSGVDTIQLIFDEQGRVVEELYNGISNMRYTYNGNKIYSIVDSTTYTLNMNGFVSIKIQLSPGHLDSVVYEYDNNGYLSASTEYYIRINNNSTQVYNNSYTYQDGNLVRKELSGANQSVATYEYYTDKLNMYYPDGNRVLYGKASKNLVKKITEVTGSDSYSENYTYEYDALGYVTKRNYNVNGLQLVINEERTFLLQCK